MVSYPEKLARRQGFTGPEGVLFILIMVEVAFGFGWDGVWVALGLGVGVVVSSAIWVKRASTVWAAAVEMAATSGVACSQALTNKTSPKKTTPGGNMLNFILLTICSKQIILKVNRN